jgi:DNA-binding GntR family transcriptional regulator
VDELYEARAVVEAGAAAILARRVALGTLPANKLNDLVDILDQLDDLAAPGAPNYESPGLIVALHRRDLDLRFHLRIVELVANNITSGAEHSILAPFHDYPSLWSEPEDVSAWQSEHRTILKALLEGDAPNAALHILGHLEKGSRRLTHLLFGAAAGPRTPNDVQHTATPAALTLPPTPTTSPPRANRLRPKGQAARR